MKSRADELSEIFSGAGLPPEANMAFAAVLQRVGYDTDDESGLLMGMTALMSALRVYQKFDERSQEKAPAHKAGRNDPCPCGSGKKYKKCCLSKQAAETRAPSFVPGIPLESTELIPRLHDADSYGEDLDSLQRLFVEDSDLKKMRFSGRKIAEFLQRTLKEEDWGGITGHGDEVEAKRDKIVFRYLDEVEGAEVLGDIGDALLSAGLKWAKSADDFRCLATGLCLADMTGGEGSPSTASPPLVSMLFWRSLHELVDARGRVSEVIDRLGGPESVRQRIRTGEPQALSEFRENLEGLDLEAIREDAESATDEIRKTIREGAFPVGLPFGSLLPVLVRLSLLDPEDPPSRETLTDMVVATADALGSEDLQLFDAALQRWAQKSSGEKDEQTLGHVVMIRGCIAEGSLGPFDLAFVLAGLRFSQATILDGEPGLGEAGSSSPKEALSPAYLERYGDFLLEKGCREMARRTWRLCELHGPLPPSVAEKLRRIENGGSSQGGATDSE